MTSIERTQPMTKKLTLYIEDYTKAKSTTTYELNRDNVHDIQLMQNMSVLVVFKNKASKLYAHVPFLYEELPTNIIL